MTTFYKIVDGDYLFGIGTNGNDSVTAITENEYNEILSAVQTAPQAPDGYTYKLHADNLEWELVESPPAPEDEPTIEDKAEAYDILMGEEESDLLSAAETLIAERTKEGAP